MSTSRRPLMPSRLVLPLIGLLLASTAEAGSTLRCGSKLISLEDHAEEVALHVHAPEQDGEHSFCC